MTESAILDSRLNKDDTILACEVETGRRSYGWQSTNLRAMEDSAATLKRCYNDASTSSLTERKHIFSILLTPCIQHEGKHFVGRPFCACNPSSKDRPKVRLHKDADVL